MSEVQATIERVTWLQHLADSDNLDIATISGFPVVVRRNTVINNDYVVYFPPDLQLPGFVAQQLGVSNYLRKGIVVKAIRLRGQYSYGMALPLDTPGFEELNAHIRSRSSELAEGLDVSEYFGAKRYVVPPNFQVKQGNQTNEHPSLTRYTDIERLEKFDHLFQAGEQVYVTEKVHGANSRVAMIDGELMVGSRKTQRKAPESEEAFVGDPYKDNMYWYPLSIPGVKEMLESLGKSYRQVILYGEVFGKGIQGSFDYGRPNLDYVAFDIMLNGEYVSPAMFLNLTLQYNVPSAPIDYVGEFNQLEIAPHIEAPSLLTKKHIREGVVVRPLNERRDSRHGRVIAKWLNPAYLVKKSEEKIEDNQE